MEDQLLTQLKKISRAYRASAPQKADTESSYARFLHSIETYKTAEQIVDHGYARVPFLPQFGRLIMRPVVAVVLALLVVVGAGGTFAAAFPGRLPGDPFYSVKIATEHAQVSLAFNPEEKVRLELEFAGRRVEEAAAIAESSLPDREEKLVATVAKLRTHLENTKSQLRQIEKAPQALEAAKTIDRKASEYGATLERAGSQNPESSKNVREAQDAVQDASFTAVAVFLEGQRTGQVSMAELRNKVREKLVVLERDVQGAAYRVSALPGGPYPEVEAVGGPTLTSLYRDLGNARIALEAGKDFFAHGGYEAALTQYRATVGILNHVTWAAGLYEKVLQDRAAVAPIPQATGSSAGE